MFRIIYLIPWIPWSAVALNPEPSARNPRMCHRQLTIHKLQFSQRQSYGIRSMGRPSGENPSGGSAQTRGAHLGVICTRAIVVEYEKNPGKSWFYPVNKQKSNREFNSGMNFDEGISEQKLFEKIAPFKWHIGDVIRPLVLVVTTRQIWMTVVTFRLLQSQAPRGWSLVFVHRYCLRRVPTHLGNPWK